MHLQDNVHMSSSTDPCSTTADAVRDALWASRCEVLHRCGVTYRYHRRRQRFFDLLDKGTKSATVLLGASLLGDTVKLHIPLVASAISGLGLLALVFGYGDRKQAHKDLAEQTMQLAGRIEELPFSKVSSELAGQWAAEFSRLNAKEPPALRTLVILCEHEQATASGHPDHIALPPWHKRVLADFIA